MNYKMSVIIALAIIISASKTYAKQCVILLHGLARSSESMQELSDYLMLNGHITNNVNYESTKYSIEYLSKSVIDKSINDINNYKCEKINFVTHSMGGILVRKYLSEYKINNLGRVVMLGPPNKGSEVVDELKNWSIFKLINGPAGQQLGTDSLSVPNTLGNVNFELGIIAGDRSINLINSMMIEGPDDGKVSVEKTKISGMKDHIVVHKTHPLMMQNNEVKCLVLSFLKNGKFKN